MGCVSPLDPVHVETSAALLSRGQRASPRMVISGDSATCPVHGDTQSRDIRPVPHYSSPGAPVPGSVRRSSATQPGPDFGGWSTDTASPRRSIVTGRADWAGLRDANQLIGIVRRVLGRSFMVVIRADVTSTTPACLKRRP
jgi:hypothetical protein